MQATPSADLAQRKDNQADSTDDHNNKLQNVCYHHACQATQETVDTGDSCGDQ